MSPMIEVADAAGLRRIALNRPEKINALTAEMMVGLAAALRTAPAAGARLVVLRGAGPKGFCAGADITELRRGAEQLETQSEALAALADALGTSAVPVVTLLHGRTLGAGALLACLSTLTLASEDVVLGFPEMHFGMYPALVHAALLARVTPAIAFQICASGRTLEAVEAQRLGLVTEVLPAERFAEAAEARIAFYAERVAGLASGRRAMAVDPALPVAQRMHRLMPLIMESLADPEIRARIAAMLGPRPGAAKG